MLKGAVDSLDSKQTTLFKGLVVKMFCLKSLLFVAMISLKNLHLLLFLHDALEIL